MKKALMTASMASMLDNFNRSNINLLLEMDYKVTLAANFDATEDSSPLSRLTAFREEMEAQGCRVVQIDFSRKLSNLSGQITSCRQLKRLAEEDFDLVHCNSPICAAMTRLAFRKKRKTHGTRVIYTAHGFHFFRGGPVKNWLLYFPVEWVCAHWTDILNTVNREDYRFAKRWLKAGRVVRLPGVGIDLEKFKPGSADREAVRRSLGVGEDEKLLLSVGELSRRKNQGSIIRALALLVKGNLEKRPTVVGASHLNSQCGRAMIQETMPDAWRGGKRQRRLKQPASVLRRHNCKDIPGQSQIRYAICGKGEMEEELKLLAEKLGIADKIIFLGYREDISELCQAADLFVFPSLQEGMPMALMEAVAVKMPVICSDIRGNRELVQERELRFNLKDVNGIAECIRRALNSYSSEAIERHYNAVRKYRVEKVSQKMRKEYQLY